MWRFPERWSLRLLIVYFSHQQDRCFLRQILLTDTTGDWVCLRACMCVYLSICPGQGWLTIQYCYWLSFSRIISWQFCHMMVSFHTFLLSKLMIIILNISLIILYDFASFAISWYKYENIIIHIVIMISTISPTTSSGCTCICVGMCVGGCVCCTDSSLGLSISNTYCSPWMDKTSCSKTLILAIMQYNGQDTLSYWMHMRITLVFMQRDEAIVTEDRDAGDGAVLTAVSMLRSLLTAIN